MLLKHVHGPMQAGLDTSAPPENGLVDPPRQRVVRQADINAADGKEAFLQLASEPDGQNVALIRNLLGLGGMLRNNRCNLVRIRTGLAARKYLSFSANNTDRYGFDEHVQTT